MRIKQELLDNGFALYYGDDIELVMNILVWLENNTEILWCDGDYPTVNITHALKSNDLLILKDGELYGMSKEYYEANYTKDTFQYDDLWEYDLNENIDKICKLAIDKSKSQILIKAKQDIISLILDAQLSSGKRFDKFINDLPVEDEVLIDFIFADDDYDLLLSEIFNVLNYLGYYMNIIDKD